MAGSSEIKINREGGITTKLPFLKICAYNYYLEAFSLCKSTLQNSSILIVSVTIQLVYLHNHIQSGEFLLEEQNVLGLFDIYTILTL
jgi:hypothetical protein